MPVNVVLYFTVLYVFCACNFQVQFSLIDILSLTFRHSLKYGKYSLILRKFAYQFSIDIDMSIIVFQVFKSLTLLQKKITMYQL